MVGVASPRNGCADAFANGAQNLQVMFVVVFPHANTVTRHDLLGRFDRVAVELYMPRAHCIGSLAAGFKHTHGPDPGVNAYGQSVSIRCCFR